jgi:hypothetical protein
MTRDFYGQALEPGVNVDPVDIGAGNAEAIRIGFSSPEDQQVTIYALQRWARGEEEGAERTWTRYHPHDFTSWRRILATAVTSGTERLNEGIDATKFDGCEVCGSIKRDASGELLHFEEECFK